MEAEIENLFGESKQDENQIEKFITYKEFVEKINKQELKKHKERMKILKGKDVQPVKEEED